MYETKMKCLGTLWQLKIVEFKLCGTHGLDMCNTSVFVVFVCLLHSFLAFVCCICVWVFVCLFVAPVALMTLYCQSLQIILCVYGCSCWVGILAHLTSLDQQTARVLLHQIHFLRCMCAWYARARTVPAGLTGRPTTSHLGKRQIL